MLVQRFIEWSRTAPVRDRVRAVAKVCESYRFATLPEAERRTAAAVMTVALNDPSERVRLALADGLADCAESPRHVVLALARDLPAISARIMASPVLGEAELVQFVCAGDEACTLAVAGRESLTGPLARAIVEHGSADAVLKMLEHRSLILSPDVLERIAVRLGDEPRIRARLLDIDAIGGATARRLRAAHADALCAFVAGRNWLSESRAQDLAIRASEDRFLDAASRASAGDLATLTAQAIEEGTLTSALLVRAAVGGQLELVEHALAALCETAPGKVASAFRSARTAPLRALLLRSGIAADIGGMIETAHRVWRENARHAFGDERTGGVRVLREIVRRITSQTGPTARPAIVRLLADLELEIECGAAVQHEEQVLLAA